MDLTIAGFAIAVVGIVLQLADAFPEHRETRKVIVVMAIGIFLGILASSMLGARYNVTGNVDRRFALLYALLGISFFFGIVAVIVSDEKRREASLILGGISGAAFLIAGFAVAVGSSPNVGSRYSTDEILLLANAAERRGQYETALDRLAELESRMPTSGARAAIKQRIERVQAAQSRAATREPR